jgi:hypothetical protein
MNSVTRRGFFKQAGKVAAIATVAGVASTAPLGIGSSVAGAESTSVREPELTSAEHLGSHEDLVAHVKNSRTGEMSHFIGNREVTFHDRKVAARLVRATRKETNICHRIAKHQR